MNIWNHMKDLSKEYQDDMKKQIIMTALGDGFFSIWMEVFCDEQEIRLAMIKAYPGTNLNCNDANGCVKEIILKKLSSYYLQWSAPASSSSWFPDFSSFFPESSVASPAI